MQPNLRFNPEIPAGYQILISKAEVADVHSHLSAARKFALGWNQSLLLEREPKNTGDRNAIKMIGVNRFWFFPRRRHIGYVATELSNQIATRRDFKMLLPRLMNIKWSGKDNNLIVVTYQILQSAKAKWGS